jgi:hypothetical protein
VGRFGRQAPRAKNLAFRNAPLMISVKVNSRLSLTVAVAPLFMGANCNPKLQRHTGMTMSRVYAALIASAVTAVALPTAASAGCYGCYTPPPCNTCYQAQVAPPQYRTVEETVMVAPGRVIAHRTPAQYRTVMVPQTVMVAPEGVQYEQIPAQYGVQQHVEMVAPARTYYVPVAPRCSACGY